MNEIKQPLDKQDENADPIMKGQPYASSAGTSIGTDLARDENGPTITRQIDAHIAGTDMSDGLPPVPAGKERIITSENKQPSEKHEENLDSITSQGDAQSVATGTGNGLAKAAIVGVVGAVVGTVAAALAGKVKAQRTNRTVKSVEDAVKDVAKGVNHTAKGTVDQVKDIEDAGLADNQTFKLYEERLVADKRQVKTAEVSIGKHVETQTAHISVALEKERVVVERIVPVDAGTPVLLGEANFYEGEIARIKVYEETPDVQKQAFVREEISIRKEVDQVTVDFEDKIRREELDLDIQDANVVDETKTL